MNEHNQNIRWLGYRLQLGNFLIEGGTVSLNPKVSTVHEKETVIELTAMPSANPSYPTRVPPLDCESVDGMIRKTYLGTGRA